MVEVELDLDLEELCFLSLFSPMIIIIISFGDFTTTRFISFLHSSSFSATLLECHGILAPTRKFALWMLGIYIEKEWSDIGVGVRVVLCCVVLYGLSFH